MEAIELISGRIGYKFTVDNEEYLAVPDKDGDTPGMHILKHCGEQDYLSYTFLAGVTDPADAPAALEKRLLARGN